MWAEAEDAGEATEEFLMTTRTLSTAVGYEVNVSKKGYVELLRSLSTELLSARHESDIAAHKSAGQDAKMGQLELKVQLLADDAVKVGDLRKWFLCHSGRAYLRKFGVPGERSYSEGELSGVSPVSF